MAAEAQISLARNKHALVVGRVGIVAVNAPSSLRGRMCLRPVEFLAHRVALEAQLVHRLLEQCRLN
jgi:hypothetical protein